MSPNQEQAMEAAACVLLDGITGLNVSALARGAGRHPNDRTFKMVVARMRAGQPAVSNTERETRERICLFVFQRLNAHVLIGAEDRAP